MASLSIGQKIIMHLDRYKMVDPSDVFNIPWDITQDGIATSLRISRAHASLELKKLREGCMVEERQTHIKGGKVKRKSYFLSPMGHNEVSIIKEFAEKNDIDIDALLDLKRQNANIIIEELPDDDLFALGCACAFRIPVPLDILPRPKKSVIPTDVTGYTVINEYLRTNLMKAADPEKRSSWHSYAADYWIDDSKNIGDEIDRIHERLYHLVESGRNREACKLISNQMYDFINTANDDLYDTLKKIDNIPKQFASDVLSTMIEVDLISDDVPDASKRVKTLADIDKNLSELYRSDVEYHNGNTAQAMAILTTQSHTDPVAGIRMAKIAIDNKDIAKAKEILNSLIGFENPNLGIERFILLAQIDKSEGRDSDAYAHLMKAKASVPEKGKKRIDLIVKNMNIRM